MSDGPSGVLIDPCVQPFLIHLLWLARAVEVTVIFIDYEHVAQSRITRLFGISRTQHHESAN